MVKTILASLLLGGALYLFLFSAMAVSADAQGALIFAFTLVPMLGFLFCAAAITRAGPKALYRTAWGSLLFLAAFFLCLVLPGLNLFPAAVIQGVAIGYKQIYGESPYEAHHHTVNVAALLEKSLEAQGGNSLDLRGLHLPYDWQRLCLFGPYTTDEAAVKAGGFPGDWPLSTYSRVGLDDGKVAYVFVGEKYPAYVVDMPRNHFDVHESAGAKCYPRENAVFERGRDRKLRPKT